MLLKGVESMRYFLAALLVAAVLAVPTASHPKAGFPYSLTFNSDGTISGTFGGVPVTGTYEDGSFTLFVDGQVFATGTYACNGDGCTFTGETLLGVSTPFIFTSTSLSATASGSLNGLFVTHGAWVSSVAKWSQANLTTMTVGQIVRGAASIQGKSASAKSRTATVRERSNGKEKRVSVKPDRTIGRERGKGKERAASAKPDRVPAQERGERGRGRNR